jgi:cation diffusion facilitator family transporter
VVAFSALLNLAVANRIARVANETDSPALEGDAAHLRTDSYTSVAVLAGLALVKLTGAQWVDPAVALAVAAAILVSGVRILTRSGRALVDETLPADELEAIRAELLAFGPSGVVGYHRLRTRRAGARRHVDLHVQFRAGTTLEDAHETASALEAAIRTRLRGADVLIHLEPEDRVRPGTEIPLPDP